MPKKDPLVDAYIAKSAGFARPILAHLRQLVHAACPEVEETLKWQCPHFLHQGMLCSMAAFKAHCSFGFWNGKLVLGDWADKDSGHGQFGRITKLSDLPPDRTLLGYIRKAAELNESGVRKAAPARPKAKKEMIVPPI